MSEKRFIRILMVTAVFCALNASPSFATITVNSIDDSRVSAYEGLSAGSTGITIYGGTAGTCATDAASTTTTCSSCLAPASLSSTADLNLQPCNDRRINPNLILSLTVTSSDHDGYPVISYGSTSSTSGTTAGTILNPTTRSTTLVSKTTPATINIPWSAICNSMTTSASTTPSNCDLGTADYATGTFNVGVAATSTQTTTSSTDDVGTITIVLRKGETPSATAGSIADSTTNGITYFEMYSGDNKGTIGALKSASGFPLYSNIRFRWVRILFEPRDDATKNTSGGAVWNRITSGSPHLDLEIQSAATDVNNLNLSPIIVQNGVGRASDGTVRNVNISNDSVYDTKVAVVDEARNVAFYTGSADDQDCETADGTPNNPSARSQTTGLYECHTLRPAVVVGVLSNKVNCFIATASYGSPMAKEVDTFRHFRDKFLIPTKLGLKFVRWYYNEGPKYAQFIRQSDTYRAVARGLLWIPLQFAKIALDYGLIAGLTFLLTALLSPLGLIYILIRKLRRGPTHA